MFLKAAAIFAATVLGTASFAATETFNFTGSYAGTYYSSKAFSGDNGSKIGVSAVTVKGNKLKASKVGQWTGGGLGVCNSLGWYGCYESHTVDGANGDDYLKFSLGQDVNITSISFSDYGNNSFNIYGNGSLQTLGYSNGGSWAGDVVAGSTFFIGASQWSSGFKIKSLTVSYGVNEVPLPAAGFLLLGGLGGLAAMKRRKKA